MPSSIVLLSWLINFQCLLLLFLLFCCRKFYLCKFSFSIFSSLFKTTLIGILITNQKSLLIIEKTVFKISLIKKSFALFKLQLSLSLYLPIDKDTLKFKISCFNRTFNHLPFLPNSFEYTSIFYIFKSAISTCFSIDKFSSIHSIFTHQNSFIMRD